MIADRFVRSFACGAEPSPPMAVFAQFEQLLDHVPDMVFFLKDAEARYLAVNQTFVERCGLVEKSELIYRSVQDVFPRKLAERYAAQDHQVLQGRARIIERLEFHWYGHRRLGWCLTTKMPVCDEPGRIIGLVGISHDLRMPDDRKLIPPSLADTLEYLDAHYADAVFPPPLRWLVTPACHPFASPD